ncbi:MAG: ABC transporter substrate-binding protein, partial [Jatrophihabitans sp.]
DGIKYVQYVGAYQYAQKLKSAFAANDYHPIFVMDPTAYDANFVAGGSQMNDTYVFIAGPLFEEAGKNAQLSAYLTWLQRTSGGAPSFFGTYAWAAASLFTQQAIELGGKLTRASLISALREVHNFTNNGMVPPQDPGGRHTTRCASIIQLQGGKWVRKSPAPYSCANTINSGVGG